MEEGDVFLAVEPLQRHSQNLSDYDLQDRKDHEGQHKPGSNLSQRRHALPSASRVSLSASATESSRKSAAFSVLHHNDSNQSRANKDVKDSQKDFHKPHLQIFLSLNVKIIISPSTGIFHSTYSIVFYHRYEHFCYTFYRGGPMRNFHFYFIAKF